MDNECNYLSRQWDVGVKLINVADCLSAGLLLHIGLYCIYVTAGMYMYKETFHECIAVSLSLSLSLSLRLTVTQPAAAAFIVISEVTCQLTCLQANRLHAHAHLSAFVCRH